MTNTNEIRKEVEHIIYENYYSLLSANKGVDQIMQLLAKHEEEVRQNEIQRISVGVANLYLEYPELRTVIKSILYDAKNSQGENAETNE